MSLRFKVIAFTVAIITTVSLMGVGAVYIFNAHSESLRMMYGEINKHRQYGELTRALRNAVASAEGWAATGNDIYGKRYSRSLAAIDEATGRLDGIYGNGLWRELLEEDIEELKREAGVVFEVRDPVGSMKVESRLKMLKELEKSLLARMGEVHDKSLGVTVEIISAHERGEKNLALYLALLIALALAFSTLLTLLMKRAFEKPYNELMRATEKVAAEDQGHGVGPKNGGDVGVIARRFDDMVVSVEKSSRELKRKLNETELVLEVSELTGMLPDLKGALGHIAEVIASKMEKDLCGIFLYRKEKKSFVLDACNTVKPEGSVSLPLESGAPKRAVETLKPFIIEDTEGFPELQSICKEASSLMVVPIVRDNSCVGLLMLGSFAPGGLKADEMDTAMILAHTISTAIRNTELYEETGKQLKQLSTVYELSKVLTSVYEPDEILHTVSSKIAELINARGCVIRLLEDGNLRIKSCSGDIGGLAGENEVPIGKGIAGWVAKEGRPLFVEDISKMPEEIRTPGIAARSAIAVPLKKDEKIIGTLGLYDKVDKKGETMLFTLDDLSVAEGFASLTAVVLEKAGMQEQQRKAEADILKAKKRMDFLFDSVQGGIVTLNGDFSVLSANTYIERWVDLPLRDILGKNAIDVFHGKSGICPHCAAKVTFDEGIVNSITQSSGLNYADLASYPVRDESGNVEEAVVFIQDITERVLYQEEIMGLYREVMQTKEYMEGLINNSADAIVTSDIEGIVKSWNPAAESIYGFRKEEAIGTFLPFVPESQLEFEKGNIEKIKAGEVLKLETFRKRKDGALIEVSLTLSPIKDVTGDIIGISGISRDITEKKRVEKELIRRNQELSRLFFISSAMRGTLELDRLLRMVLTAVTMSDGLGFNRSILFLLDEETNTLKGTMGVGPANPEEAWDIWEKLSTDKKTLHDIMHDIEVGAQQADSFLDRLSTGIETPMKDDTVLSRAARERKPFNVTDVKKEPFTDMALVQQLGTEAFAVVPLVYRDKVIGVLWVDNQFNRKPITGEDMKFLIGFADQVASAIEAARLFHKVSMAEAELENIFRSISDMVFFTGNDYTVKNANQAVMDRLGKPREEIVGRKCYEVFHGLDRPLLTCPHHKTVENRKAYVEEYEDAYLGGTYISSTAPMFDADGMFQGTVHVVRDITEMKDLRVKLHSAERMAALGEVAAKVAHEIRNPLVSVGGFAKRLEDKLEDREKEYAHIILEEVRRLEGILKDILGFVKEIRMSRELIDLNDTVKAVLDLLGGEFKDRGNAIVRDFSPESVIMLTDPDRIKEAVLNIVSNANQAMDGGTVSVRTYRQDGYGVLEVSDTGCGIRKEDINRIFDPFFTTRPTGTGLGLAISKRIVEENSGLIGAESGGAGAGTKFTIKLPLKEV
jgi:PAS domain S-box-containing protein